MVEAAIACQKACQVYVEMERSVDVSFRWKAVKGHIHWYPKNIVASKNLFLIVSLLIFIIYYLTFLWCLVKARDITDIYFSNLFYDVLQAYTTYFYICAYSVELLQEMNC